VQGRREVTEAVAKEKMSLPTQAVLGLQLHNSDNGSGGNSRDNTLALGPEVMPEETVYIAPDNFAMVQPGVYRSGFPKMKNFPFLQRIGLKSILTLVLEEYPHANKVFLDQHDMRLFQFGVPGNKEPFVDIPEHMIRLAVEQLLDVRNHPILIHCNKGKHRTGCLVGCLRKACGWNLCSILDEYIRFSTPKSRFMDQQFIELFDVNKVRVKRKWVPSWIHSVATVSGPGAMALPPPEVNNPVEQQNEIDENTDGLAHASVHPVMYDLLTPTTSINLP